MKDKRMYVERRPEGDYESGGLIPGAGKRRAAHAARGYRESARTEPECLSPRGARPEYVRRFS